jgi:hypothetical protein
VYELAKQKNKTESEGRIINIMADGRIVEDLTGHVIPVTPETEMAYQIMAQVARRRVLQEMQKNST